LKLRCSGSTGLDKLLRRDVMALHARRNNSATPRNNSATPRTFPHPMLECSYRSIPSLDSLVSGFAWFLFVTEV